MKLQVSVLGASPVNEAFQQVLDSVYSITVDDILMTSNYSVLVYLGIIVR